MGVRSINSPGAGPTSGHACQGSDVTTAGVRVRVAPMYHPQKSDPDEGRYVFVYRICITNTTGARVRLLHRHWMIIDAHGRREDVRGEGVVGVQPVLGPGESFEYQSYCPLPSKWGTMEGTYTFAGADGGQFEVRVGRFYLVADVER